MLARYQATLHPEGIGGTKLVIKYKKFLLTNAPSKAEVLLYLLQLPFKATLPKAKLVESHFRKKSAVVPLPQSKQLTLYHYHSMRLITICAGALLLVPFAGHAQTKPTPKKPATAAPAAKPTAAKPAAAPAATPVATEPAADGAATEQAPIALAPVTPAADPNALKIKADLNPISH
nr:hypothetical protein [Tanacetum cinerariifolium]